MKQAKQWPHYKVTLDAIYAAATAYFENNSTPTFNKEKRWHPEDVACAVMTCAEAIGAGLGELLHQGKLVEPQ